MITTIIPAYHECPRAIEFKRASAGRCAVMGSLSRSKIKTIILTVNNSALRGHASPIQFNDSASYLSKERGMN
jgi:hypothetical protein